MKIITIFCCLVCFSVGVFAEDVIKYGTYKCVAKKRVGISNTRQGQFSPKKGEGLFRITVSKRKINSELCKVDLMKYIKDPFSKESRSMHLGVKYCINTFKVDIEKNTDTLSVYSMDGLNYTDVLGNDNFQLIPVSGGRLSYKYYYGIDTSFLEKGICNIE
jgi:hypothetical protein